MGIDNRQQTTDNRQQDTDSRILGLGKNQVRRQKGSRSQLLSRKLGTWNLKLGTRPKGALLPIGFSLCLTAQTKRRPGYGLQPFLFNRLPAIHALAKVPFIEPT